MKTLDVSNFLEMNTMTFFLGTKPYINFKIMSETSFDRRLKLKLCGQFYFSENCWFEIIVISNSREIDTMNSFVDAKPYISFKILSGQY